MTSSSKKSDYKDTLDPVCRSRYIEKMKLSCNVDPYHVESSVWCKNVKFWPDIAYPDIVNYLINAQTPYSLEDLKSYKSLESYNYFISGWVSDIGSVKLPSNNSLVMGKVKHSQRMTEPPLKPWVIL